MTNSCDMLQLGDDSRPELIALSVRSAVAFDATHVRARGSLFLLTEGLVVVETATGRFLAPPRGISWMPPGLPHAVQSYGPTAGYGAFLAAEFCGDLPAEPTSFQTSPLAVLVLQKAVDWQQDAPLDPAQMRLLLVLIDEIRQTPTQPLQLPWPTDARLLAIARALLADVSSPRRLEQWASWADISPRSLSRKFVQETGMTFAQWRQWARLTQALEWLATGRAVKDVALSLGYDSVSAFIKVFRQALGATPATYFNRPRGLQTVGLHDLSSQAAEGAAQSK
ncbi:HTH-type transcriptional repressor of iron protein A [mine drainage metagenome]|uniref:HTH-type transcriptional repressor of iron protein A n=1 Tax=mine drainage metagenome TaxID=410659 RepID=A0A1J5PS59_9ZZZZ